MPHHVVARYRLGNLYDKIGRWTEAEAVYREALELLPGDIEAITHYTEAVKYKSDFADAHLSLGALLGQQQRWDEAVAHFQETLRLSPNHELAQKYLAEAMRLRRQTQ